MLNGVKYSGPAPPVGHDTGSWRLDPTDPDPDAIYVDGWRIDCDQLYHKHTADHTIGLPETEYDVNGRECWMCETSCPDPIWFAHMLQQLP
jgi:hypothetical protein